MYYSPPEIFIPALLSSSAEINASDQSGQSPILEDVGKNHPSALRVLLRHSSCVSSAVDSNDHAALFVDESILRLLALARMRGLDPRLRRRPVWRVWCSRARIWTRMIQRRFILRLSTSLSWVLSKICSCGMGMNLSRALDRSVLAFPHRMVQV